MSALHERFGGEALLSEKFPAIHEFLENAREDTGDTGSFFGVDAPSPGKTQIYTTTVGSLPYRTPLIMTSVDIWDDGSGKRIDSFYVYSKNVYLDENTFEVPDAAAKAVRNDRLRADVVFAWAGQAGEPLKKEIEVTNQNIFDGQDVITSIDVSAPRTNVPGRSVTQIAYGRNANLPDADYSYENVTPDDRRIVNIHAPFKGELAFSEDFEAQKIMNDKGDEFNLRLLFNDNVSVYYGDTQSALLKFTIDNDSHTIAWDFKGSQADPDNWGATKDLSSFSASTVVSFYCDFAVKFVYKEDPERGVIPHVYVSSTDDPTLWGSGGNNVYIPPIYIQWGCLAKDTLVAVMDGDAETQRPITGIKIGDIVVTEGGTAAVANIHSGTESRLILIGTDRGKEIRVTGSHPIRTGRGLVRADDMSFADTVVTVDGEEGLADLYFVDYGDMVYNLQFARPETMVCNGIFVGDYGAQNDSAARKEDARGPLSALQKEAEELFGKYLGR